jgi:acyl-CoA synthetase (AMP-forming)/AMP-acid ligase II
MRKSWRALGDQVAIRDDGSDLTGRELLEASGRLEVCLAALGCANAPIAVLLPRCAAWPIALLGIRAAYAIFAPIDPEQPDERIAGMLKRLQPAALLCLAQEEARFAAMTAECGSAVQIAPPVPHSDETVLLPMAKGRTLGPAISHIFHTSGSTGQPKAVLLSEPGLLAVIKAQCDLLPPAPGISLWALGPGFDASLSDVLCPILSGRVLHIHRPSLSKLRALKAALQPGMVADLPPSMLRYLKAEVEQLGGVVFGGERAPADQVQILAGMRHAFQAYGPTEASVCCMSAAPCADWEPGLLGVPLVPGSMIVACEGQLHRMEADDHGQNLVSFTPELPDGAYGQLVVAGELVGHGYLDQPEATSERFGVASGERFYLTGDLVHYVGGRLFWKGRLDRQVKINGRMVYPEEIELAALRLGGTTNARALIADNKIRLFVCGTPPPDLAGQIARTLGPTFRPASVHYVTTIPLTASGKPDDAQLLEQIR